jgi:osmotically inducible protein OsmC
MRRRAVATWEGDLKRGKGAVSSESGAVRQVSYNFSKRFEQEPGTNPEELIGAAFASCYSMALSGGLAANGTVARHIETEATVTVEPKDGGFSITRVDLSCHAEVPGCTEAQFAEIAENTRKTCPVARALAVPTTLHAHLV